MKENWSCENIFLLVMVLKSYWFGRILIFFSWVLKGYKRVCRDFGVVK